MTIVYSNPIFLEHDTGVSHPEHAGRLGPISQRLLQNSLPNISLRQEWPRIDPDFLKKIHASGQIEAVHMLADAGGGALDADTVVSAGSYAAALAAVSAGCAAVDQVLTTKETKALCLVRPPGHHANHLRSSGFCLFNNIAVAARMSQLKHGVSRILIIDWDVHHGNGTQDIFYNDEHIFFLSMHRFPFYPGTGAEHETGSGPGLGFNKNLPVTFGTTRKLIREQFEKGINDSLAKLKPELILISAGFDAHRLDPIGSLGLETEDFAFFTQLVTEIARTLCGGRIVSFLEGGYNPPVLADCIEAHLQELSTIA